MRRNVVSRRKIYEIEGHGRVVLVPTRIKIPGRQLDIEKGKPILILLFSGTDRVVQKN